MISKNATHFAFAFLVLLTAVSWGLNASGHAAVSVSDTIIIATMIIAFFKAGVIIAYFMEVKDAPRVLQLVTGLWVVGSCTALTCTLVL